MGFNYSRQGVFSFGFWMLAFAVIVSSHPKAYAVTYYVDWTTTAACNIGMPMSLCEASCLVESHSAEFRVVRHPNADPAFPSDYPQWACQIKSRPLYCPPPYQLYMKQLTDIRYTIRCHAYCPKNHVFDHARKLCIPPKVSESCETQSSNPIDFFQGKKYRREHILSVGKISPIKFDFLYNSHMLSEKTLYGFHRQLVSPDDEPSAVIPTTNTGHVVKRV